MSAATAQLSETEAFVERFAAGWAAGTEGFFDRFLPLATDDVLLRQPLLPAARGHEGFRALFEPLFAAIPDLRGDVLGWTPEPDGATIELALHGTLDGVALDFVTHDRIVLRDGLMAERHAQFSPRPLLAAALRRPRAGLSLLAAPLVQRAGGDGPLLALAAGRLWLGALGRLAPRRTAILLGAGAAATPELDYMTRVFGVRAIALGAGYLTSEGAARRRWQRLAFMCDVSDTLAGVGHLRRRDIPRGSGLALTALTGAYAVVGGLKLLRSDV